MIRLRSVLVRDYRGLKNHRLTFTPSETGHLTILEGPNEAGKTTLLRFVRAALFGTDAAEGQLVLEKDGRPLRIEVSGKKSRVITDLHTGEPLPQQALPELLGSVDHKVFENVFAFGLGELQELSTLTTGGVQEKIFAAGVAGAGPSARKALKTLEAELQEYLKPIAKSRLKDLAQDISELRARLRQAEMEAGQYQQLLEQRSSKKQHLSSLQQQKNRLQHQLHHLERLSQFWDAVWAGRMVAEEQLRQFPSHPQVKAEDLQDAERLETQVQELQERIGALDELSARLSQQLDFNHDDLLISQGVPLRALMDEVALQHSRLGRLTELEVQTAKLTRDAGLALQKLPSAWTRERLEHWQDTSWEDTLQHHLQERQRCDSLLETLSLQHHDLSEKARQARQHLHDHPAVAPLEMPATTSLEKQLRDTLQRAQERQHEHQRRLQDLHLDHLVLQHQAQMDTLHQRHAQAHLNLQTQQQVLQDLMRNAEDTRLALSRVQPWNVEQVLSFDQDSNWRKEASLFAQQLRGAQLREEAARQHHTRQRQDVQSLTVKLEHTPAPQLAGNARKLQEQDMQIAAARARLQEVTTLLSSAAPTQPAAPAQRPLLVLGLAVLIGIFTWNLSPLLSFLVFAAGGVAAFLMKPIPSLKNTSPDGREERLSQLREELKLDFQKLGLPPQSGLADLDRLLVQLKSQQHEHQQLRSQQDAHDKIKQDLQAAQKLREQAAEQHQQASTELEATQRSWQEWTASRNLTLHHPDDLTEFLASVVQAQQLLAAQQNRRRLQEQLKSDLHQFKEEALSLLAVFQTELPQDPSEVLTAVQALHLQLQEALRTQQRQQDLHAHLEHLTREVQDAQQQLDQTRFKLQEQHVLAQRADENAQKELQYAQKQLEQAKDAAQHATAQFLAWAAKHQLVSQHPSEARTELLMVQDASRQLHNLTQAELEHQHLHHQISFFESTASKVLEQARRPQSSSGFELLEALRQAVRDLEDAQQQQQALQITARKMKEVDQERQELEKRLHALRQALRETYNRLNVTSLSQLREHWVLQQERLKLEQRVHEAALYVHRSSGQHAEAIIQQLNQALPVEWGEEQQEMQEELHRLDQQVEDLHLHLAQLDVRLQQLEESASATQLKQTFEHKQTQLVRDAHQWVVRRLAQQLLAGTLKEYERTKGPEVLRHASEVFASITEGRYQRVRANDNHTQLRIFQEDDHPLDVQQLSRGTQEQLYLSVRLGLARVLGERTVRLPLIMDDVLVNADPERASGLAQALAEVSKEHQVIYLTCHPLHTQILQAAQPGAQVLKMQRLQAAGQVSGPETPVLQNLQANHILEYLSREGEPRSAEQIRLALNADQTTLSTLLGQLINAGSVDRVGQKRGTRYALKPTSGLVGD